MCRFMTRYLRITVLPLLPLANCNRTLGGGGRALTGACEMLAWGSRGIVCIHKILMGH